MKLIESILADAPSIAAMRRDIHAHPELCFEEERTSELIARALADWGIEVHRGLGKTGVVGIVRGGSSARAVGLRADIDALPMTEHNRFDHASRHPGRMHACGHDGHTAMLLAAAKHLAANRGFDGSVVLVFQPAEEGGGGAREMIADGLFERFPMESIFGAHNWPGMAVGQFALAPGPVFASSNDFQITISGKGAHGAMPNLGIDPVPAACQMVQAFQTIVTRNKRPLDTAVISVTMIHAGEATNVIPDTCTLGGTARTFTTEVLDLVERRDSRVETLSHGNQQRVQLAVSLAFESDLLILDEPFSGLDPIAVTTMGDVIREEAHRGAGVLFYSHQLDLVEDLCDDVVIVNRGRVVLQGRLGDVRDASPYRYVEVLGEAAASTWWRSVEGAEVVETRDSRARVRVPVDSDPAAILTVAREGGAVSGFSFEPPSLSDLFVEAVGRSAPR